MNLLLALQKNLWPLLAKLKILKLLPFLSLWVPQNRGAFSLIMPVPSCCVCHPSIPDASLGVSLGCCQMVDCSSWEVLSYFCLFTSFRYLFSPCQCPDPYNCYLCCLNVWILFNLVLHVSCKIKNAHWEKYRCSQIMWIIKYRILMLNQHLDTKKSLKINTLVVKENIICISK